MTDQKQLIKALTGDLSFGFINRNKPAAELLNPKIISNSSSGTMLHTIRNELKQSRRFIFSVAFVTPSAIALLKQDLIDYGGSGTIITSTYLGFNNPRVFYELLNLPNVEVFIYDTQTNFHPKGYIFEQDLITTAVIGSSNLTESALLINEEWNLRFSAAPDGDIVHQLQQNIADQLTKSTPLTYEWVEQYSLIPRSAMVSYAPFKQTQSFNGIEETYNLPSAIKPNMMQREALKEIQKLRAAGEKRAIVVSATGTGKTILSALEVQNARPKRLLFVVHREQILDRAIDEFKKVILDSSITYGKLAAGIFQKNETFIFATIQTLSRDKNLASFAKDDFDYIIIDEVHRAGAETYQKIIDYFAPEFLLGFTATPERTDGFDLFELFEYNVPYEIRLQRALESSMLAPFHYYGVTDYETEKGLTVSDTSKLQDLIMPERVDHLLKNIKIYGHAGTQVKGLIFCSAVSEAKALSQMLNTKQLNGKQLRTVALTGEDSVIKRERAVSELENGKLDYLITVDIFNEGVDIPAINQIIMMRKTDSSIIFTQQLGRGLRKYPGKDHLIVIDFIGNYTNNYLIPIALFGDSSLNKDTIRKKLIDAEEAGAISGLSSVNFDKISMQRIFDSITATKLDSMAELKKKYNLLKQRLGGIPKLLDFARFDTVDPVVIATKKNNYNNFLNSIKESDETFGRAEDAVLTFLSKEILNGKRPHEILLLKELIHGKSLLVEEYVRLLGLKNCTNDEATVKSVLNILNLSFYTEPQRRSYGDRPLITEGSSQIKLSPEFLQSYESNELFRSQVDDILETGIFLSQHRYGWSSDLVVGQKYSRKEVCRALNWKTNQEGTIFGYKVDLFSGTCPIFITYHKADDISSSTKYEDELLSTSILKWYSRSNRTLSSAEVKSIVGNEVPLHIFAKKDDAEGLDFFYLGEAISTSATDGTMTGNTGKQLSVVTMELELKNSLEQGLYDYLTSPGATK